MENERAYALVSLKAYELMSFKLSAPLIVIVWKVTS
jgi:hypothetical protein